MSNQEPELMYLVALESGRWSVARQTVEVQPGDVIAFDNLEEWSYFRDATTNVNGQRQRRALTTDEWNRLVAEHKPALTGKVPDASTAETAPAPVEPAAVANISEEIPPPATPAAPDKTAAKTADKRAK